jgi:hypothetical protein
MVPVKPEDGDRAHSTQLLTTRTNPGIHEKSAKAKIVHMKLSLRLSFQLSRSLKVYTVGTTAGFRVMTMEALAPWPHL